MPLMNSSSPYAYNGTPTNYSGAFDDEEYQRWMRYFTQNGIGNLRLESPVLQGLAVNPAGTFGGRSSFNIQGVGNEASYRRAYEDVRKTTLKKRGEQDQPYYLNPEPRSLSWSRLSPEQAAPFKGRDTIDPRYKQVTGVSPGGLKTTKTVRESDLQQRDLRALTVEAKKAGILDKESMIETRAGKLGIDQQKVDLSERKWASKTLENRYKYEQREAKKQALGQLDALLDDADPQVRALADKAQSYVAKGGDPEVAIRNMQAKVRAADIDFTNKNNAINERLAASQRFTQDQRAMSDIRAVTTQIINLTQTEAKISAFLSDPSSPPEAVAVYRQKLDELSRFKQMLQAHADALRSGQQSPLYGQSQSTITTTNSGVPLGAPGMSQQIVTVTTREESDALPPGTRFRTPDGRTFTR